MPDAWHDVNVNVSGIPTSESRLKGIAFEEFIQDPKEVG